MDSAPDARQHDGAPRPAPSSTGSVPAGRSSPPRPRSAATVRSRDEAGGHRLPKPADDLLRDLARWGYLTTSQAAALQRHHRSRVETGQRQLRRRALAVALHLTARMAGSRMVYALTDAGREAARGLPDRPVPTRARLDQIDRTLAAVHLALELRDQGAGTWLTWAEYRRRHAARVDASTPAGRSGPTIPTGAPVSASWPSSALSVTGPTAPPPLPAVEPLPHLAAAPVGVLCAPDGRCTPLWIVLHSPHGSQLKDGVLALFLRRELEPGRVYALPTLVPLVEGLGLQIDDIRPWQPPHLHDRAPMQPGWWRAFTVPAPPPEAPESSGAPAPDAPAADGPALRVRPVGPRQLAILAFLDRFGHATLQQVARAMGIRISSAHTALCTLEASRRVQRRRGTQRCPNRRAQEDVWSATEAGLAAIASPRVPLRATPLHRAHSLALVDLAHRMEAETGGRWEAERELSLETVQEAGRRGRGRRRFLYKVPSPDARLTLPDGRRVLIQLQLSFGAASTQCLYARRQIWEGIGDEVWFVCTPEVAPRYRREIRPHEADLIRVREWTPPDRSGGLREPNPGAEARRRRWAMRNTGGEGGAS